MPDSRTNSSVAERLDLHIERLPNRLHRRRRWLTLACGLLPLGAVTLWTWQGDHTIYLSRPVSASHEPAQADCKNCHRTPWQPLVRLANLDNQVRSVHDRDCQQCHRQSKDDHNPFAMPKGVPDCVVCHQEHRGSLRLTAHSDEACVKCHASFDKHPEFAVHRAWPPDRPSAESDAMMYRHLLAVAEFPATREADQAAKPIDRTALRFNHQNHLRPLAAVWNKQTDTGSSPKTVQLQCHDCHQADQTGLYMRPIVFEEHCMSCHPLRFSGKLSDQPLPHETPDIVHGVLRDRLMAYAREHPNEMIESRLPNKASRAAPIDEWRWVEEELRLIETNVFQKVRGVDTPPKNNPCQKCHLSNSDEPGVGFEIIPPNIPARWLIHARFDHGRHRDMACIDCHHVERGAGSLESTSVKDILMPKLEVCQNCHGATRTLPTKRYGRQNCVECHQYHHVSESNTANGPSQ